MLSMIKSKMYFVGEQDGDVERDFKTAVKKILCNKHVRAYLVQIKYTAPDNNFNVALCLKAEECENQEILESSVKIFKSMFGQSVPLDIIFINDGQERLIRDVCCPFFTAKGYQVKRPDFYLISNEGYDLKKPIACFKRERLYGKNLDGYLLCDIHPTLLGENYKLTEKDIKQIILANRHLNYSLFPIKEWPVYVHIAIPQYDITKNNISVSTENLKLIAWGELHKSEIGAISSVKKLDKQSK